MRSVHDDGLAYSYRTYPKQNIRKLLK